VYIVAVNLFGLLLALGLNSMVKSRKVLMALFFFPAVVSPLAIAYVWRYILDLNGALNQILDNVGLDSWQQPWLGEPRSAMWSVAALMVWQHTGWHMLIYLAGLQSIQAELYEAAAIDGASPWRRFLDITRPLLLPAFTVSLVLSTIMALLVFDQVIGLTGGGPIGATETVATYIYKAAFQEGRFGYSASVAVMLTLGIGIVALIQNAVMRRRARWRVDV
jgi:raffinose/stachyose/melibiose transport system permease protein